MKLGRVLGASGFVLLLLVGVGGVHRHLRIVESEWAAMHDRVAAMRTEIDSRPAERPVLWGQARRGGSAWQDYERAVELFLAGGGADVSTAARASGEQAARLRTDLVTDHAAALAHLRAGAQRARATGPVAWDHYPKVGDELVAWRGLADLAVLRAVEALATGDDLDAVRWLLDGAQMARDLAHRPLFMEEVTGVGALGVTTWVALVSRPALPWGQLGPDALLELDRGLAALDRGFAERSVSIQGEIVAYADAFSRLVPESRRLSRAAWRYGFSERFMFADFVREGEQLAAACASRPAVGSAGRDSRRWLSDRVEASPNPWMHRWSVVASGRLQSIAIIRILRTLVSFRRHGTVLRLQDPFSDDPLGTHRVGDELKVWTVGRDGLGLLSGKALKGATRFVSPNTPR